MDKLKMHSPNLTEGNIAKLAELFPSCVTEARDEHGKVKQAIDFDQLRQELSDHIVEGPQERYHLNWPGKRDALLAANAPIAKTLRPSREDSVDFDSTKNLFIEGDNLEALKLLQETYLGKVKMIYIDPPYNTGNDFIYSDDFSENRNDFWLKSNQVDDSKSYLVANPESNGRFHSAWLSMLYSRLKLARNLLKEDGVIFISIDDNELSNLQKICNEVFGEGNFLGVIANVNNPKGRSDDKFIATSHEYIVVYARNVFFAKVYGFEPDEKIVKRYNKIDEKGNKYREIDLRKTGDSDRRVDRPDMFYYFYFCEANEEFRVSKVRDKKQHEIEIYPIKEDGSDGRWRWGFSTAREKIDGLIAKFMPTRKMWGVFEKDYLVGRPPVKSTSSWTFKDVNSERGSEQFIDLGFGKEIFNRPKPLGTLKRCLEVGTVPEEESLVLDFFAGSGGIAQAAFELSAEQKRDLKFILVQLPEICSETSEAFKEGYKNIAEISKERMRRAGQKILKGEFHESWNRDIGFRVLKIDSSNMQEVYYQPGRLSQDMLSNNADNIRSDRTSEDLLFQVLLDWGVDLSLSIAQKNIAGKTVYFVDGSDKHMALAACFDLDIDEAFVKQLAAYEPLRAVFRDAGFANDSVKINVEQIFAQKSPNTDVKVI